jgi:hypothetical protein
MSEDPISYSAQYKERHTTNIPRKLFLQMLRDGATSSGKPVNLPEIPKNFKVTDHGLSFITIEWELVRNDNHDFPREEKQNEEDYKGDS